ncbi:hypothetical protein [Thermotoga sp. KOL6]|uniref:hypothetical protein n=1 Tax=Thermotoga sp. KOL6 TaxID=126741 RepID=UPI000C759AD6|nr:hypothetical protein [Thermotoga sp. KOL6]PLV59987.1 hypothetical protein AS005_01450 [Thermotoga sp. KOL6]
MRKLFLPLLLIVGGLVFSHSFVWTSDGYRVKFGETLFLEAFNGGWGIGVELERSAANFQKIGFLKVKTSEVSLKTRLSFGNGWNFSFVVDQKDLVPFPGTLHYEFFIGRFGGYALLDQKYVAKIGGYKLSTENFSYMSKNIVMFWSGHFSMGSTTFSYRTLNDTFLVGISDPDNVVFLGMGGLNWKLAGGAGFNFSVSKDVDLKLLASVAKDEFSYGFMVRVKKETEVTLVVNTNKFYISVKF